MEYIIKLFPANSVKLLNSYSKKCIPLQRCCSTEAPEPKKKEKPHPYRNIHPWKSLPQFSSSLVKGIIHNEGGLVAINKPYGISGKTMDINYDRKPTRIVNGVEYSLEDAAPHIATELNYPTLHLIKTPEKFTSGIALFAADEAVKKAVEKSLRRAEGTRILAKTYWIVTTKLPNTIEGEMRLGMEMREDPSKTFKQPVIVKTWTNKEQKDRTIKILNVQFKLISNSIDNLSSFMQIRTSTTRWHALRLFAATVLHSPILGDEKYGSRVKNIMGKWVNLSPWVEAAREPPKLDGKLLRKLNLARGKESLIPVHIHLREMFLPSYRKKDFDLILTAPPMPEFAWTCKRLGFKHDLFTNHKHPETKNHEETEPLKQAAVS